MDGMPLRCSINKQICKQPELLSWLQRNQQRQQELLEAYSSFTYRQFLLNFLAAAEQRVYELAKGRSQLLGCKLPQVRLEEQWPEWVGGLAGMPVSMLEDPIWSLWSCFKGRYLIFPAEGAVLYLLDQQQQQEGVEGRYDTSKNRSKGSNSSSWKPTWVQCLDQQCNSRFDVGCLWLYHQPNRPHDSTQTLDGDARKKGAQDLGQAAATAGPTSGKGVPLSSSAAAAAARGDCGVDGSLSDEVEGGQSEGVSVAELQLVVNMLLLLWPQMRSSKPRFYEGERGGAAGAQKFQPELPRFRLEEHFWDWLLVLAALLQQAPVEAKQQLMKDHGTLLLQLLYHVLLDHEAMGKRRMDTAQVLLSVDNMGEILKKLDSSWTDSTWKQDGLICTLPWTALPMSVVQLVLMVLQSLVFVVDMSGQEDQAGKMLDKGVGILLKGGKSA
jgi:hypothetical protein